MAGDGVTQTPEQQRAIESQMTAGFVAQVHAWRTEHRDRAEALEARLITEKLRVDALEQKVKWLALHAAPADPPRDTDPASVDTVHVEPTPPSNVGQRRGQPRSPEAP